MQLSFVDAEQHGLDPYEEQLKESEAALGTDQETEEAENEEEEEEGGKQPDVPTPKPSPLARAAALLKQGAALVGFDWFAAVHASLAPDIAVRFIHAITCGSGERIGFLFRTVFTFSRENASRFQTQVSLRVSCCLLLLLFVSLFCLLL